MKLSEVTILALADYMRLDEPSEIELSEIGHMKSSAIGFIVSFTGLTVDELDEYEDVTQALFLLVADMFDNRNLYIEGKASNVNKAVVSILSLHSTNLL